MSHYPFFNFLGAPSISQEWLKLELNLVHRVTISNFAKWMINHLQKRRGDPIFLCNCGITNDSVKSGLILVIFGTQNLN